MKPYGITNSDLKLPNNKLKDSLSENVSITYWNLWDIANTMIRGNFIALNAYIRKDDSLKSMTKASKQTRKKTKQNKTKLNKRNNEEQKSIKQYSETNQ